MNSDAMPRKTRELQNHHFDSTIWNDFRFREDDIVIATYAKSGTTWVQQIVAQLLFDGQEGLNVAEMSPWVDLRIPAREVKLPAIEAQPHRRFLKTHLPVDALVFSPQAKYLYIGRDGRDVLWSMYHHHATANDAWYEALNDTPGRVGPPMGWLATLGTPVLLETCVEQGRIMDARHRTVNPWYVWARPSVGPASISSGAANAAREPSLNTTIRMAPGFTPLRLQG